MKRLFAVFAILVTLLGLSGCGYNTLQSGDEQIKAAWAEVLNQYQRRADLVPNLVNTVKGFAEQEKSVLIVPGDHFGLDRHLRIGYGGDAADLREGLGRLDDLLGQVAVAPPW